MARIFESPDGGNTVYSRESGSNARRLEYMSQKEEAFRKKVMEDTEWSEIRLAATSDSKLQEALDRVKVLYYLSRTK